MCIFFLFITKTNSQNDSISKKSFQELSDLFYKSKPDTLQAVFYADTFLKKALKEKDTMKMLDGKYYLADIKNNDNIYLNFCDSLIGKTKHCTNKKFPNLLFYDKGVFLYQKRRYNEALNSFFSIDNSSNDSIKAFKNMYLGLSKCFINDYTKGVFFFKKSFAFFEENENFKKNKEYISLLLNMSVAYRKIKKLDSAYYYNKICMKQSKINNDSLFINITRFIKSSIDHEKKKFNKALNGYLKSIPYIIKDENFKLLNQTYSIIGIISDSLNKKKLALEYHLKSDSIYNLKKIPTNNIEESFKYLLKYYRNRKKLKKQLIYVNRLLNAKEINLNEKEKVNKTLTEKFDIPNLLSEKKKIITQLENEVKVSKRNKLIYMFFLILGSILIVYQVIKKRIYKKRFLALTNNKSIINNQIQVREKKSDLAETIIAKILNHLNHFEDQKEFLNSELSLQSLADKFNTNSNYLSKVINQHMNTSFSNYVNKLRVEYTVEKLKIDSLWQKYTIKAIAMEVGFNNSESFSKAFFKFTGLKPSYFIKELEKNNFN